MCDVLKEFKEYYKKYALEHKEELYAYRKEYNIKNHNKILEKRKI